MGVSEKREARRKHLEGHINLWGTDLALVQKNIRENFNLHRSHMHLASYAQVNAMNAWVNLSDLDLLSQW
jgi:hypothetical protein